MRNPSSSNALPARFAPISGVHRLLTGGELERMPVRIEPYALEQHPTIRAALQAEAQRLLWSRA